MVVGILDRNLESGGRLNGVRSVAGMAEARKGTGTDCRKLKHVWKSVCGFFENRFFLERLGGIPVISEPNLR